MYFFFLIFYGTMEKKRERFMNFYAFIYFYRTTATPLSNYRAFRDAFVLGIRKIYTTFAEWQVW